MKYFCLVLFVAGSFVVGTASAQRTRIVDNNSDAPSGEHVYADLQEAVDASSAGDTIQVVPSLTQYGPATIKKKLFLVGVGFNPDRDMPQVSMVQQIDLQNGEFGENPSGTIIRGVETSVNIRGDASKPITDITLSDSRLSVSAQHVSGLVIARNIVNSHVSITESPDIVISNNVFHFSYISVGSSAPTLIANNIFIGNASWSTSFYTLEDATISSNIFYGALPVSVYGDQPRRSVFNNNLTRGGDHVMPPVGDGSNTGSGNLVQQDPRFASLPTPASLSSIYDFSWDLSLGGDSPARGSAEDGGDIGIGGGQFPQSHPLRGAPAPLIKSLTVSSSVVVGGTLNVQVQATGRSN